MPNAIDMHIGKRLQAIRVRAKVSRAELAMAIDVNEGTITAIEMGVKRLGPALMLKVTQQLGIPVADLFSGVKVTRQLVTA
jgi:DNA-binding XRE family transcriptional regulator